MIGNDYVQIDKWTARELSVNLNDALLGRVLSKLHLVARLAVLEVGHGNANCTELF